MLYNDQKMRHDVYSLYKRFVMLFRDAVQGEVAQKDRLNSDLWQTDHYSLHIFLVDLPFSKNEHEVTNVCVWNRWKIFKYYLNCTHKHM